MRTTTHPEQLVRSDSVQVFFMICPCHIPLNFARHTWVVCNDHGKLSRWELLFSANRDTSNGHLHINALPHFSGIGMIPLTSRFLWKGKVLGIVEGNTAEQMIGLITKSGEIYPHKKYSLLGTNSNTYTQWILNNFPEVKITLPWNCFGKNAT